MQNSAAPITPHEMPKRAELRHVNGPFKPLTCGRMFSFGTCSEGVLNGRCGARPLWVLA